MLIEVSAKEFKQQFGSDPHPFISEKFIELNKGKVDKIVRLVEDTNRASIGLVAGIKNGTLKAPFSAPFGGFHYRNEDIYISVIESFLKGLKEFARTQNLNQIILTLPPAIYQKSFNSKVVNTLIRLGFEMTLPNITSWVQLRNFSGVFTNPKTRGHYQQALKNQLIFSILKGHDEQIKAYELICGNRNRLGRPIYMTFDDIQRTSELWPVDFFGVHNAKGQMVASAIYYQFPQNIAYDVFWGDNDIGRPLRAMDFLVYNLWNHYKSLGFEFIDLSISTESGIPNESLLRFKETHECTSSIQHSFKWNNNNTLAEESKNKYMIHPSAEVQTRNIGEGTTIWQYSVVLKDAVIGKNCNINFNVFIENDVIIGDNVTVKSGVQLWDGMRIENDVFIGPNVTFTNVIKPRSKHYPLKFIETILKLGASIGANSSVIGGITIGKYAMIGAGSVVTKNIPDYTLWYGNPAVLKANICSCTNMLDNQLVCVKCKKAYEISNGQIREK